MEKKLNRSLYIIPAIYLILAGLFFYLHCSQTFKFSQVIGNIELTGQSTKGSLFKPSEIKKLSIYVNGISFNFSSKNVLEVHTEDDILHRASLLSYSTDSESFTLYFENDISLIFKTDFADNKISVSAGLPETIPPIIDLIIPFHEDRGFTLEFTEEDNTPVISNGETNFFISLTNEYKLDNKSGNITILVPDSTPVTFMIQDTLVGKGRTAEQWYDQNDADLATEYDTVVSNYINNAFFGWNSRFNSKTGMWTDGDGNQKFDETTATSYLSESLVRGSYRTSASLIRTASVKLESELTAQTAPYLGNIVEKGAQLINSQNSRKNQIQSLINSGSSDLFKEENLISFMLSNKLESSLDKVISFALSAVEGESTSDSINRLRIINAGYSYINNEEKNSIIEEIIENNILPSVNWLDEGLFLEEDNTIFVDQSFTAGRELLTSGRILDNNFYTSVGIEMIISILTRSKDSAFLPLIMEVKNNRIDTESGNLLPEEIYFELTENPYYLAQDGLVETLGSGSWILTAAQFYDVQKTARETSLTINFPKGSTHYIAIKGVKPFVRIYMHGTKWPSDPNFQRYSDGWVYSKATETLFIKMKHRNDNERVRILYYNPDTSTETPLSAPAEITGPATTENS